MAKYVLVEDKTDKIIKSVDGDKEFRSGKPPILSGKPFRWLKLVEIMPVRSGDQIIEGPAISISDTQYTKTWTVRDKTSEEIEELANKETLSKMSTLKALMTALNDGSFVAGQNLTNAQMKKIIKDHL